MGGPLTPAASPPWISIFLGVSQTRDSYDLGTELPCGLILTEHLVFSPLVPFILWGSLELPPFLWAILPVSVSLDLGLFLC